jgi:hypothetical protein
MGAVPRLLNCTVCLGGQTFNVERERLPLCIIYRYGVVTTSGLQRLLSPSGFLMRRATSVIFRLCLATSKM